MEIKDYIVGVGQEFNAEDFKRAFGILSEKQAIQVNDKYNREWKIRAKDFVRWIDPRVEGAGGIDY